MVRKHPRNICQYWSRKGCKLQLQLTRCWNYKMQRRRLKWLRSDRVPCVCGSARQKVLMLTQTQPHISPPHPSHLMPRA